MVASVVRVEIKHECDIPKLATTTVDVIAKQ